MNVSDNGGAFFGKVYLQKPDSLFPTQEILESEDLVQVSFTYATSWLIPGFGHVIIFVCSITIREAKLLPSAGF